jgi:branched-chain amino acid transport system permease protein
MVFDFYGAGLSVATFFGIYALLSLSLNFQYGVSGLPNFGQVLFYGMGAYAAGTISVIVVSLAINLNVGDYCNVLDQQARMNAASADPGLAIGAFLAGIIAAAVVAGFFGLVLSYPAIRIDQEWYLALILLIAAEIVRVIARNYGGFLGVCSFNGLGGIPSPFQWVVKQSAQALDFALLTLGFVAVAYFYFERSLNSPWGRMLKSIRDDPVASKTFGKNVTKARIQVMVIGSAFAGVAGALFTFYSNYVTPDNFIPVVTFNVWVMIVLGGLGNNKGALLGTLIVTLLQKVLSIAAITLPFQNAALILNYSVYVIEGGLFIALLIFRPSGIIVEKPVKTPADVVLDSNPSEDPAKSEKGKDNH